MGFFGRLMGLLTRGGRDDDKLLQGVEHAKAKRPERAIEIYDALLKSSSTSPAVQAGALFNRSLAHSAMNNDDKALADLQAVIAKPNLPTNIQTAARERLARLRKRSDTD